MDVQSITPYPYQAEKKSNLVGESAKLEVSCLDSRQKNHEENRAEQEDKQANHFGLDLELPHPDHYLPETVDFPSSPSAMMKYRVADDDELSHSPEDHRPEHNEPVTDSEDEESLRAVIDTNNSVRLKKGNPDRRETAKIKKRLSATDDSARMDDDSDDDINLNAVCPVIEEENVLVCEDGGQPDAASGSDSLFSSPIDGWDLSPEGIRNSEGLQSSLNERMDSSRTKPDLIPETSAQEEKDEERNWRSVVIMGLERKIDLKVIEPYKKVLSHGGYQGNDCQTAVIVFSACFLPDRSRVDYDYVMEHLFLYVLTTLDQLVAEDYVLIYFHGATPKSCIPRFSWVKNCYQMIDRRLRKNLKRLYLVHPTLWLKAAVLMCRPFISTKFSRKIVYIPNLPSLSAELPMDHVCIPDRVKQLEFTLMIQDIKRRKGLR